MEWTKALTLAKADPNKPNSVRVIGKKLCLWKNKGRWFAFDLRCPHEGYPLSQGDVDGNCVLTCRWHNWRFRLEDGEPLRGEDRLKTYAVKEQDGALWVDVTEEPEEVRQTHLLEQFERHFTHRYYGAMARVLVAWDSQNFEVRTLHTKAATWVVPRLEQGFGHSLVSILEWAHLAKRFSQPSAQLACHLEALDFLSQDAYGEEFYPFPTGELPFEEGSFLEALETEDEATALTMLRCYAREQGEMEQLEATLTRFVFRHYLGYGHPAIYLSKLADLMDFLGPASRESLILGFGRYLMTSVRDDLLPEFRQYATVLAEVESRFKENPSRRDVPEPPPLASSLNQVWIWLKEVSGTHDFHAILKSLILASARNLLYFDLRRQYQITDKPQDHFSWLDLTHALTFAEASLKLSARYAWIQPAVLVQMAAFVGRVHPAINPDLGDDIGPIQDLEAFKTWAAEHILNHGETEAIYPVHGLKTFLACEKLEGFLPQTIQDPLWAAVQRYLTSPFPKKHPQREVCQAMDLLDLQDRPHASA